MKTKPKIKVIIFCFLMACALVLQLAVRASAVPITITGNGINEDGTGAYAGFLSPDNDLSFFGGTTIPTYTTVTAIYGGNRADTIVDWQGGTDWALLEFGIEQSRTNEPNAFAQSMEWDLYFTANTNTTYSLMGDFSLSGKDHFFWGASLSYYDGTDTVYLFNNSQWSISTPNESFLLGNEGGDYLNDLEGALNGNLIMGQDYTFSFMAQIVNGYGDDEGATASGGITLAIGEGPSPVPEPATMLLFGVGLGGLGVFRKKLKNFL